VETVPEKIAMNRHYEILLFERSTILFSYISQQSYGLIENNM
jgi:hypothetical protein